MAKEKTVILGLTASIAIYKSCDIIRKLRKEGFQVIAVETASAEELIRPIVFQSLTGNKVYRGMFDSPDPWQIEHISLAEKADLVLVAPATANIIGKVANGICDDLLTCLISATTAPVLFCPAMNVNMYKNKITQANIRKLKVSGYKFCAPVEGALVCGKQGIGCLAPIDVIVKEVKKYL
jgi:phosphopantothenoylcysteine decarboxylase/phosphopantothenate--cysteine ligase